MTSSHERRTLHSDRFMKRTSTLGLIIAWLILLGYAGSGRAGLFTGSFAPANWEVSTNSSNPGTFAFTGTGNAEVLEITGAAADPSETFVVLKSPYSPAPSSLHFSWAVANNGNDGSPLVYYVVNGTPAPLVGSSGTEGNVYLPADTEFGFAMSANVIGGKIPAVFMVTDWEVQTVPEIGSWLAGPLALGVAFFIGIRRQWRRAAGPAQSWSAAALSRSVGSAAGKP